MYNALTVFKRLFSFFFFFLLSGCKSDSPKIRLCHQVSKWRFFFSFQYPISFEAEVNPELQLTWESCKCLMRKGEDNPLQVFTQYNQPSPITLLTKPFLTKPHRPRPQQQQYNRPTYPTTTTQAPSEPPVTITENENGYVQRFILATDQIENW